jgi:hypothetical protein
MDIGNIPITKLSPTTLVMGIFHTMGYMTSDA